MNGCPLARRLAWIALLTAVSVSTAGASPATLLAYYPFEEGRGDVTADAMGGNGSASLIGDVAFKAEGRHGLGLEFNGTLLAGAGGAFDLLSEHHYAPVAQAVSGPKARREVMRLAKMPVGEVLGMLRGTRDGAKKAGGSRIGIAFDEWNIWHDWFARPFQNEWHVGPIDGIYAAAMLNMLCRESGNLGLSMACYFQPVNEGLIAVQPFSSHLTAAGQAFTLLGAHRGNRLVPVSLPRPTGGLDACASASPDGKRLVLVIVNRNLARPREIELSPAGARIGAEPSARFLTLEELAPNALFVEKSEELMKKQSDRFVFAVQGGATVRVDVPLVK